MGERPRTERTRVRREPDRGVYDRATIDAILDEGLVCHLGFVHDGQPFVIPTLYGRIGDEVFVHGSSASRTLRTLDAGVDACLTVTLVDGIVLARSIFNHSINYRSVVVLGRATAVRERTRSSVRSSRSAPGCSRAGGPTSGRRPRLELKATAILRLPLDEASAKVRVGPPKDDEADLEWPVWAGVIPLSLEAGDPVPDPELSGDFEPPAWRPRT